MKIFRNGEAFELTFGEIIRAHEEYELECAMEDIRSFIGPEHPRLSDEQVREIAIQAMHNLTKNDSYFESYWMSVKYTFDDYIDNLLVDEEEDDYSPRTICGDTDCEGCIIKYVNDIELCKNQRKGE